MRAPRAAKKLDRNALQNYANMLLAQRAMSSGDLRQKLRLRAQDLDDIDPILDHLRSYGALDDARYAELYASARKENQALGKSRVSLDLSKKRIPRALADKAIENVFAGSDEVTLIEQFLERKFRGKNLPVFLSEQKNLATAFRRLRTAGYSAGNALKVLRRHSSLAAEIDEDSVEEPEA